MKYQFSLRFFVFAAPFLVIFMLFLVKESFKKQNCGWSEAGLVTKVDERPLIEVGRFGGEFSDSGYFGYIVVGSDNHTTMHPKILVENDWGRFFAGRRIPRVDGEFYLALYKDGKLMFFDEVDDEWIQYKFSRGGNLAKDDIKAIAQQVGIHNFP